MIKDSDGMAWIPLAAMAALGTVTSREAQHQMEVERLTMELAVCTPAGRHEMVHAEFERRRDLFAATWAESPRTGARPDVAALKSVVDDIVNGRWLL